MHVEKKQVNSTKIALTITATEVELLPIKNKVVEKLSQNVKIPGFREGKAPAQVTEKSLDPNALTSEFINEAINQLYVQALQSQNINPVAQPTIEIKKIVPYNVLEFEAQIDVIGAVKVGKYKKLSVKKEAVKITPQEVEGVIKSLLVQQSTKKDVNRAGKVDDQVWIDFTGKDAKGKPVNGADGKDYPIILGSKTFIPGFEQNVEGLKAGAEKTFTIPFPKDYGVKALAGRKVTFTVKVNKVQEVTLPKLDDEFAKKTGPFKTLDELKTNVNVNIQQERATTVERQYEAELLDKIFATSKVEIPEVLISHQAKFEIDEQKKNLTYRGQTYQEFLESEGTTEEKYEKEVVAPKAEKNIAYSIILSEIAKTEDVKIEPQEMEAQITQLKAQYQDPAMQEQLNKPEARRDIASRMLTQKTIEKIKTYQ
ncbi:trigger factor [Candidatus Saccharibacteria bacterium RIFCSPHIGHO2_12_FULL_41_12]|nr:MAG: trigger factor [Candidatus Saccharibacteria bacterium RIFCSPHIGHO2_12_FULL_41_12]